MSAYRHIGKKTNISTILHQAAYDARHEKTDLKIFVVVTPKEGWARPCAHPSFGLTLTFQTLTLLTS